MARIAQSDGIATIIATPHQLGAHTHNQGSLIRQRVDELQELVKRQGIPLEILPGADVRIEPDMIADLLSGKVLTLADKRRHVLLELPHELYFPLEPLIERLHSAGFTGVLSHPERNQGILKQRRVLASLVEQGCLMQVTAGSINGTFGPECQELAQWMLAEDLVHIVATDAHGPNSRRPLMSRAFQQVSVLAGADRARELCCSNPAKVARGEPVPVVRRRRKGPNLGRWFRWSKAA